MFIPASAPGLTSTLVVLLGNLLADPRFDIGRIVHVFVVGQDLDVLNNNVLDRGVLQVLAETPYRNAIPSVDGDLSKVSMHTCPAL